MKGRKIIFMSIQIGNLFTLREINFKKLKIEIGNHNLYWLQRHKITNKILRRYFPLVVINLILITFTPVHILSL